MLEIDGSRAGGQLVRTAVALSALTGKTVKIINIRGARPAPGLKIQHMEGIKAIGELCSAEISGLELNSRTLEFKPKELKAKNLEIKVSTAGAIGLILQALLIPASVLKKEIKIKIKGGGTFGKWAPPVLYLQNILFPLLNEKSEIKILRHGFYPKGGAEVEVLAKPLNWKEINITERGKIIEINGVSIASKILEKAKVAERQADKASDYIEERLRLKPKIETKYAESYGAGSGILLWAKTENSVLGGDAIGERGKRAEKVGEEAAKNLVWELKNGAVDRHAGDMLLPYLALAGKGSIATSQITQHIKTNISVVEKFLPVKFEIKGLEIKCKT